MKKAGEERIIITQGDITRFSGDVIVNAANSSLMGGGGVDGAIHAAGGSAILEECRRIRREIYPEGLPPGKAVLTTAGNLSCSGVIHTVGPVWQGGLCNEDRILTEAYRNSLALAAEKGFSSIAFPAISTGVYGFPPERAASLVKGTLLTWIAEEPLPRTITLYFFSPGDFSLFEKVFNEKNIPPKKPD